MPRNSGESSEEALELEPVERLLCVRCARKSCPCSLRPVSAACARLPRLKRRRLALCRKRYVRILFQKRPTAIVKTARLTTSSSNTAASLPGALLGASLATFEPLLCPNSRRRCGASASWVCPGAVSPAEEEEDDDDEDDDDEAAAPRGECCSCIPPVPTAGPLKGEARRPASSKDEMLVLSRNSVRCGEFCSADPDIFTSVRFSKRAHLFFGFVGKKCTERHDVEGKV